MRGCSNKENASLLRRGDKVSTFNPQEWEKFVVNLGFPFIPEEKYIQAETIGGGP